MYCPCRLVGLAHPEKADTMVFSATAEGAMCIAHFRPDFINILCQFKAKLKLKLCYNFSKLNYVNCEHTSWLLYHILHCTSMYEHLALSIMYSTLHIQYSTLHILHTLYLESSTESPKSCRRRAGICCNSSKSEMIQKSIPMLTPQIGKTHRMKTT